jgi:hypothetical protein
LRFLARLAAWIDAVQACGVVCRPEKKTDAAGITISRVLVAGRAGRGRMTGCPDNARAGEAFRIALFFQIR